MNDPQQRARQRGIAPIVPGTARGEEASQLYAPNSVWTVGAVRSVSGNVILWQRIRYTPRQTPTVGAYEAYGPIETGYPQETKSGADFAALAVSGEITTAATPIRANRRGGFWIIERI